MNSSGRFWSLQTASLRIATSTSAEMKFQQFVGIWSQTSRTGWTSTESLLIGICKSIIEIDRSLCGEVFHRRKWYIGRTNSLIFQLRTMMWFTGGAKVETWTVSQAGLMKLSFLVSTWLISTKDSAIETAYRMDLSLVGGISTGSTQELQELTWLEGRHACGASWAISILTSRRSGSEVVQWLKDCGMINLTWVSLAISQKD